MLGLANVPERPVLENLLQTASQFLAGLVEKKP